MTIKERLRDWLGIDERALTPAQIFSTGYDFEDYFGASSGQAITPASAMEAAQGACVRLLADDISTQPWDVYEKQGQATVEVPKPRWMRTPSGRPTDLFVSYVSDWVTSVGTDGNAFTLALPNVFEPEYVEILSPDTVEVFQRTVGERSRLRFRVGGKEYDDTKILHVPWVRLPGELRGINPVRSSKDSIGLELAAIKYAGAFFREGGTMGTTIMTPGGPETVDVNGIRDVLQARHRGEKNWWKPLILTGGATKDDGTIAPNEAEINGLWMTVLQNAARIYHIPPHLLSIIAADSARASVEERGIGYVRHAVRPFVTRFEWAHNVMLGRQYMKANLNALMRGDAKARAEFYSTMLDAKVMAREEVRELEDLPYMGELGWLETPNNNGIPDRSGASDEAPQRAVSEPMSLTLHDAPINVNAAPMNVQAAPTAIESAVHVDSVRISDEAARQMVENSQAGFDVLAKAIEVSDAENRSTMLKAVADFAMEQALRAQRLEEKVDKLTEPSPPENFHVRARDDLGRPILIDVVQGSRVIRKKVSRDESGHVISIVAA